MRKLRPKQCGAFAVSPSRAWSAGQHGCSLLHECRRPLPDARPACDVADRPPNGRRRRRDGSPSPSIRSAYGAALVSRSGSVPTAIVDGWRVQMSTSRPGKGILGRIRPSLPRRPYEDGHLLQLERCHDVQQHSGGLAAAGGGGHAPRRRVDWSCGSACRRWPGARSGAAC